MGKYLHILRLGKDFLNRAQKAVIIKGSIKYISLKLTISIHQKKAIKRVKRQHTECKKIKSRKDSWKIDVYTHTHTQNSYPE